jgi:hypothetical protein
MIDEMPNSKKLRKLKAIEILISKSINPLDMAEMLKRDGVFTDKDVANIAISRNKPEDIFRLLETAKTAETIDLLDYEWQILPSQRIVLTIVTPSGIREFRHEEP